MSRIDKRFKDIPEYVMLPDAQEKEFMRGGLPPSYNEMLNIVKQSQESDFVPQNLRAVAPDIQANLGMYALDTSRMSKAELDNYRKILALPKEEREKQMNGLIRYKTKMMYNKFPARDALGSYSHSTDPQKNDIGSIQYRAPHVPLQTDGSIRVHEWSHALGLSDQQEAIRKIQQENNRDQSKYDWDPDEKNSQMNSVRYRLNINPEYRFKPEDMPILRNKAKEMLKHPSFYYVPEKDYEERKYEVDPDIDRFFEGDDGELVKLLNSVAYVPTLTRPNLGGYA